MEKHIKALGVLYIVFGSLGILGAVVVYFIIVGGGILSGSEEVIAITSIVGTVIALFLLITSIPEIIGGIGLLNLKGWARILVIILGFLNLIDIPVGTAIGIYTIWVLFNDATIKLFKKQIH